MLKSLFTLILLATLPGCGIGLCLEGLCEASATPSHASGVLDLESFGTMGYVHNSGSSICRETNVAIQTDGKIVLRTQNYIFRYNTDGTPDTTFGAGTGRVNNPISYSPSYICPGGGLAVSSDGKILVGGTTVALYDAVARLNADGTVDTTFGVLGTASYFLYESTVNAFLAQNDGKIVMAVTHVEPFDGMLYITRRLAAGGQDNTFNVGSMLSWGAHSNQYPVVTDIKQQADGKYLMTGEIEVNGGANFMFSTYRITNSGAFDPTWGTGGENWTEIFDPSWNSISRSLAIQSDGKVLVGGTVAKSGVTHFAVVRYLSTGALDTTFSSDGITTQLVANNSNGGYLALQADGKILITGGSQISGQFNVVLMRYLTDGTLDTTFGTNGISTFAIDTVDAYGSFVVPQVDGKILIGGSTGTGTPFGSFLTRIWP